MIGLGTIINTCAIVLGGAGGLIFGKKLPERFQKTLMSANGICVIFLGISGTLEKMLVFQNGSFSTQGTMMLIASLSIGAVIGELLNIDSAMEKFGEFLKRKTGSAKDTRFVDGFVTASLTVCIGAMAVVGAIEDGIYGDPSTLIAKSILDAIIVLILSSTMGKGCLFSAIPVLLFQGAITAFARLVEPLFTEAALSNLSMVGSVLITCVGINLLRDKKIKVANLLPSIIIAVAVAFIPYKF